MQSLKQTEDDDVNSDKQPLGIGKKKQKQQLFSAL